MKEKIIVIGPGLRIGGVERSRLSLLDAIDYTRYDVDLFLYSLDGEFRPFLNENVNLLPEYRPLAMVSKPIKDLIKDGFIRMALLRLYCKAYGNLRARITGNQSINISLCKKIVMEAMKPFPKKYDYAIGFFGPHYLLTEKVNARVKVGWVHTDYSNDLEKPDFEFITPMWRALNHIACVSTSAEKSFQKVFPMLADRTVVIENIISSKLIYEQAAKFEVDEMKTTNSVKILSVGRFCTAKAFDLIPEVCSTLIERGYCIQWFLIGYGPDENLIKSKIREYSMEDFVKILGKKTNPYPYMQACDIYVQPSRYEGKAVTVTEAQILHKPVMITRYATSSSQVEEGVDGYICEMGAAGVVEGLSFLLDNQDITNKLISGTMSKKYDNYEEIKKIWDLK